MPFLDSDLNGSGLASGTILVILFPNEDLFTVLDSLRLPLSTTSVLVDTTHSDTKVFTARFLSFPVSGGRVDLAQASGCSESVMLSRYVSKVYQKLSQSYHSEDASPETCEVCHIIFPSSFAVGGIRILKRENGYSARMDGCTFSIRNFELDRLLQKLLHKLLDYEDIASIFSVLTRDDLGLNSISFSGRRYFEDTGRYILFGHIKDSAVGMRHFLIEGLCGSHSGDSPAPFISVSEILYKREFLLGTLVFGFNGSVFETRILPYDEGGVGYSLTFRDQLVQPLSLQFIAPHLCFYAVFSAPPKTRSQQLPNAFALCPTETTAVQSCSVKKVVYIPDTGLVHISDITTQDMGFVSGCDMGRRLLSGETISF